MMRVLVVAPRLNGVTTGEPFTAFKLLEQMAQLCDLTVLAYETRVGPPLAEQLPAARVVTFEAPAWTIRYKRFAAMSKIGVLDFNRQVRRWLNENGADFDIAHQMLPRAPRYASELRHLKIPYVIGTLGGALPTPPAFQAESGRAQWFTRLRALDGIRFRYDPWLRASYARAALVLGVAPYMKDILAAVPIKRFEPFLGIGVEDLAPNVTRPAVPGKLKLLHVGRAVRTKGLRDVVRALDLLKDLPDVTLTSIGDGEEIAFCQAEARRLGLSDRVQFLGRLPREEIEDHYRNCDVLAFPSFRESMGGVLYEAMRWGVPIITARAGGPDYIVDDSCGLKVDAITPQAMTRDLAHVIRELADDPDLRARLGAGGRAKLEREALWPVKAKQMIGFYGQVLESNDVG